MRRQVATSTKAILGGLLILFLGGRHLYQPAQAADARSRAVPAAPTNLTAHWAGTVPAGRLSGVVLTWNAVPGATSYNIYSGVQVVPRPPGPTFLLRRGQLATTFVDPDVGMGVDTIPEYQVTAVNAAGESHKSNIAEPGLPVADIPTVIQGTVIHSNGRMALVKTPDHAPICPPGQACPQIIVVGATFEVDLANAVFEAPDGTPIAALPLASGDAVVVVGHKAPPPAAGEQNPLIAAQVVELASRCQCCRAEA